VHGVPSTAELQGTAAKEAALTKKTPFGRFFTLCGKRNQVGLSNGVHGAPSTAELQWTAVKEAALNKKRPMGVFLFCVVKETKLVSRMIPLREPSCRTAVDSS